MLLALADGQTVESVLLPKGGLCVSTQVGCAVGCTFCMTGRDGLQRQLGSAEIVAQVALARSSRAVKKVVLMGMGEPAHNLDNVLEAIELLGTLGGIGHKTWSSPPSAIAASSNGCRNAASSRRWRSRCTPQKPSCARNYCRVRRASTRPSSSPSAASTRAQRATRSSTSGPCWRG